MEIWIITETILVDEERVEGIEGWYSTKEKAIEALYNYLLEMFDEDDLEDGLIQRTYEEDALSALPPLAVINMGYMSVNMILKKSRLMPDYNNRAGPRKCNKIVIIQA